MTLRGYAVSSEKVAILVVPLPILVVPLASTGLLNYWYSGLYQNYEHLVAKFVVAYGFLTYDATRIAFGLHITSTTIWPPRLSTAMTYDATRIAFGCK